MSIFLNVSRESARASYGTVTGGSVVKFLPMILIAIASFVGNALVLTAICRFKQLRTFSNLYIGSLAITDVLASFAMLLSYTTSLLNGRWIFGYALCNIQGFSTTLLSSTSMLTLLCFSIYRCYLITTIQKRLSIKNVGRMVKASVVLVWLLAFLYSTPPLFGSGQVTFLPQYDSCLYDFSSSKAYSTFLVGFVFTVPLIVMLIAYIKIIKFMKIHNKTVIAHSPQGPESVNAGDLNTPSCSAPSEIENQFTVMELKRMVDRYGETKTRLKNQDEAIKVLPTISISQSKIPSPELGDTETSVPKNDEIPSTKLQVTDQATLGTNEVEQTSHAFVLKSENLADNVKSYSPSDTRSLKRVTIQSQTPGVFQERLKAISVSSVVERWRTRTRNRQKILRQYQKRISHQARLVRILLVTVVAFVFCWFPFAMDSFLLGIGHTEKRPKNFQIITIWLAYTNALCNPTIYAVLNRRFKNAFKIIFKDFTGFVCACKR